MVERTRHLRGMIARLRPRRLVALFAAVVTLAAFSQSGFADIEPRRQYLELSPSTKMDLEVLLDTLEASLDEVAQISDGDEPVVIVLHGREANAFTNMNYTANKSLVDRAARLDANALIDVRMCATWMRRNSITPQDIPPFIDTVPFAPEEIRRLKRSGYERYTPVDI